MSHISWQKSSHSPEGNTCVEIAAADDVILLRESDNPEKVITTSRTKLEALILGVKAGEFDHFTA